MNWNIKILCGTIFFLVFSFRSQAQDPKILAQSEYYAAEEAYSAGKYSEYLERLDKSEGYAGNNHLIQYLRAKRSFGSFL